MAILYLFFGYFGLSQTKNLILSYLVDFNL